MHMSDGRDDLAEDVDDLLLLRPEHHVDDDGVGADTDNDDK